MEDFTFRDGGSFQLKHLVTTGRLRILRRIPNQIRRCKQIALESRFSESCLFKKRRRSLSQKRKKQNSSKRVKIWHPFVPLFFIMDHFFP